MRALAICAVVVSLPGCVFYFDSDDPPAPPDAIALPPPDAQLPAPDADPWPDVCGMHLACPAAAANKVSVCGEILDVATDERILPPAIRLRAYDALELAAYPDTATELAYESLVHDECGRFRMTDIQRPQAGFLAIGVDDAGDADVYARSALAFPVSSAQTLTRVRVYAITHATDAAWTTDAGLEGASLVARGAILALFRDGDPVSGVTITESGTTDPADDYYFSDTDPRTRATLDPGMDATGPNGAAIKIDSPLVEHSGTGACDEWQRALAASIPGVLFVAPRYCL